MEMATGFLGKVHRQHGMLGYYLALASLVSLLPLSICQCIHLKLFAKNHSFTLKCIRSQLPQGWWQKCVATLLRMSVLTGKLAAIRNLSKLLKFSTSLEKDELYCILNFHKKSGWLIPSCIYLCGKISDRCNEVRRRWEAEGRRHLHGPVFFFCRSTSQTDLCAEMDEGHLG